MKRGNNYSGARWTFSQAPKAKREQPSGDGLTISGGSSRAREAHRSCIICGGTGRIPYRDGSGVYVCAPCHGTGRLALDEGDRT